MCEAGGDVQIRVSLAEVDGVDFMNYPSVRLTPGAPELTVSTPGAGQFFGILACDRYVIDYTLDLADDAEGELSLRVDVSTLHCDGGGDGCDALHGVDVIIPVQ